MVNNSQIVIKNLRLCSFYLWEGFIPLHRPLFSEDEKRRVTECMTITVSSAGKEIEVFEGAIADFTEQNMRLPLNGTASTWRCTWLVFAKAVVITQAVSFVATANAVSYCRAAPVFIDVDLDTMGMSPEALTAFLHSNAEMRLGKRLTRFLGHA